MWSKSSEAKPSSQASDATGPATVPAQNSSPTQAAPVPPAALPAPVYASPVVAPSAAPAPRGEASTIAAGIHIRGDITGTSDLFIHGEVHGKIKLSMARVTVGSSGKVYADIDAREIVVDGTAHGNLKAAESVQLGSSGRVQGSVMTPRIAIEEGARLSGKVETTKAGDAKPGSEVSSGPTPASLRAVSARAAAE